LNKKRDLKSEKSPKMSGIILDFSPKTVEYMSEKEPNFMKRLIDQ
jgi:hypothetical protein